MCSTGIRNWVQVFMVTEFQEYWLPKNRKMVCPSAKGRLSSRAGNLPVVGDAKQPISLTPGVMSVKQAGPGTPSRATGGREHRLDRQLPACSGKSFRAPRGNTLFDDFWVQWTPMPMRGRPTPLHVTLPSREAWVFAVPAKRESVAPKTSGRQKLGIQLVWQLGEEEHLPLRPDGYPVAFKAIHLSFSVG